MNLWEEFTLEVIKYLNERLEHVVFILWGNDARAYKKYIDKTRHLVLESVHPSPLSANAGFFGCGHFIQCNAYLKKYRNVEVDWNL